MKKDITFGSNLSIQIEVPKIENLKKIIPYREEPVTHKNGSVSRLVDSIPSKPGIYFLFHKNSLMYIGNGKSIRDRINYRTKKRKPKEIAFQKRINPEYIEYVTWILIEDKVQREIIETIYLNKYPTAWNSEKCFTKFDKYPDRPWDKDLEKPEVVKYIRNNMKFYHLSSSPEYLYDYCKKIVGEGFEPPPIPASVFESMFAVNK